MTHSLPLLVFPSAKSVDPPKGHGGGSQPHVPTHEKQVQRLSAQLTALQEEIAHYKASCSMAGFEPETVLVIEIAGSVDKFRQAVEAIGLEWLGERDIDDIKPDEDFYERNDKGKRTDKPVKGRMFLSLGSEAGMREMLKLWKQWKIEQTLPHGKTKWRDVFNHTRIIRRWGIEETLRETGMIDRWRDVIDPIKPEETVRFQIELFYRKTPEKRTQSEQTITDLLRKADGRVLGSISIPEIDFHAVKAELPAGCIRKLMSDLDSEARDTDIQLFKFHGVMYFRPTGQSLAATEDGEGVDRQFIEEAVNLNLPPIAAILDGAPNLQHKALKGRLSFDDPDNLSAQYQPGERKHGTAMASLVVHGEMANGQSDPLPRQVHMQPIMQPDPQSDPKNCVEHIPDEIFFEDRVMRAVRRMFEGEGRVPAQAPDICIVNLSIGDPDRPFVHSPSPWARLIDWLSWKYRVLFCVSAGNYEGDIDIGLSKQNYLALNDQKKVELGLKCIQAQLSGRRILSPAESINAITVGAMHADSSGNYTQGQRTDILPNAPLFSPISRLGHGFRRSVKPEILFPAGRQLYKTPILESQTVYTLDGAIAKPGQEVASDSKQGGFVYTRGTSNATALATRSAARIYEVLDALRMENGEDIPRNLIAVLIKALLVHGATQDNNACKAITDALKTPENSRKIKEVMARYLGYGAVQIERVLACTEQRGTVLGCGEIRENEVHEYRLPLPPSLSSRREWRRMVVTLAWFSPINPDHRNYREAKLEVSSKWGESPLKLARKDANHNQVTRGTVQHEVLEGSKQIAEYQDGDSILLHVACKADATERLDTAIPYGLAVTLEVEEGVQIPIYEQLRARLRPQVTVGTVGG
ncbi:MAG: S8 family peptidase [Proteobacteria bacterium]|nr:S8 family peptidase [Pseudomonadota bacterium]